MLGSHNSIHLWGQIQTKLSYLMELSTDNSVLVSFDCVLSEQRAMQRREHGQ